MTLRIPKYLIIILATVFQLVNALLDYRLGGQSRLVSLYSIAVLGVAISLSYHESLLFTGLTAVVYLIAGHHPQLPFTLAEAMDIVFLFGITILMSKLMSEHRNVRQIAVHDPLTGLYNHAFILNEVQREIERSHRYGRAMSVVMLDIDHFKRYNDTYGHLQGDVVLRETAYILRSKLRTTDMIGRYGGEEFAAVLPEANLTQARMVAERLRTGVTEHSTKHRGIMIPIHISLGVATCTPGTKTGEILIEQADQALYEAKRKGRNQVVVFTPGMAEMPGNASDDTLPEPDAAAADI